MANKSVGYLTFNFGANMQGFDRALNKASKKLKRFGDNMTSLGRNLSAGLTAPIVGLGIAAVKMASDFAETDSKFKQVFVSIQGEAEKTAKTFVDNFGLSEQAAKQLLGDTGDLLVGFGFTEKAALELSAQVNELAVDLASFTNFAGGSEGASKSLTKALVGETESAKALGIVIRQGTKEYKDRVQNIIKTTGVSLLQAKAMANLQIAMEQSQKAQGDFQRTQDQFANRVRILKEDFRDLGKEIGEILLPMVENLTTFIEEGLESFKSMSKEQKENIVNYGLMAAAIGPLLIGLGSLASAITKIVTVMRFLKANPILLVAGAFITLMTAVDKYANKLTDVEAAQKKIRKINSDILTQNKDQLIETKKNLEQTIKATKTKIAEAEKEVKLREKLGSEIKGSHGGGVDTKFGMFATATNTGRAVENLKILRDDLKAMEDTLLKINKTIEATPEVKTTFDDSTSGTTTTTTDTEDEKEAERKRKQLIEQAKRDHQTFLDTKFKLEQDHLHSLKPLMDQEIADVGKKYDIIIAKALENGLETKTLEEAKEKELQAIRRKFADMEVAENKEKFDKMLAQANSYISSVGQVFSAVGGLLSAMNQKDQREMDNHRKKEEQDLADRFETMRENLENEVLTKSERDEKMKELNEKEAAEKLDLEQTLANKEKDIKIKMAKREKAMALMNAIVNTAQAVTSALTVPFPLGQILAGIVGGLGAAQISVIQSTPLPTFAQGGIVSGPTVGLMGEYAGANSNPEVIAPLSKLKSMMSSGQQTVQVVGRISGNDIIIASERAEFNRQRYV